MNHTAVNNKMADSREVRLLPIPDAARYLGMTTYAMRHRIAEGRFPYVRMGKRIFLDRKDLDRFIEDSKVCC